MSPDAERTFEREWVVLSRRLRLLLARKRVDPSLQDDLVQETALRLLSMWDSVDLRRPLWPLTVTIALNILRDRGRLVNKDDLMADIPERGALHDVEAAGLARVELARVREAMGALSQSQRSALMKEIGGHAMAYAPDTSGEKMLRMRARRKLKSALESVSGVVALRLRKIADFVEAAFAAKEGATAAASCVFCLVLGVGATVAVPASLTPKASAGDLSFERGQVADALNATYDQPVAPAALIDHPRAGVPDSTAATSDAADDAARNVRRAKERDANTGSGSLLGGLPQDDDQVITPPSADDVSTLDPGDPPSLPGGSDEPLTPPAPPAPPVPVPVPELETLI